MELVLAGLLSVMFPGMVICMFMYFRSGSRLVKALEAHAPEVWRNLGCPHEVYVRQPGSGGIHTVQPLFPYLTWLMAGEPDGLRYDVKILYTKTRSRLWVAGTSFAVVVCTMLALFTVAS